MAKRAPPDNLAGALLHNALGPVRQLRVMGRFVRRRVKKPGTAPGTLVHTGPKHAEEVRITLFRYDESGCDERELPSLEAAWPFPPAPAVTWVNVDGLHDVEVIRDAGQRLGIHPLVLEDIVNVGQRAKMEEHEGFLYLVLPMLTLEGEDVIEGPGALIQDEQVSLVLGAGWVLTFQERKGDAFDPVRDRVRVERTRIRASGADYLCYALVDAVVDRYFALLESVGHATERLELEVMEAPTHATMSRLHDLKRELLVLRRAVWPVREMVAAMGRSDSPLITANTKIFLRDVYDHAVQVIDAVESLRDVVNSLSDLYISHLSMRTNEIMKVLTIMATIFIPLTFVVGVYGMNFDYMPELRVWWAYPAVMGLMAAVALGMLWFFRRKDWI